MKSYSYIYSIASKKLLNTRQVNVSAKTVGKMLKEMVYTKNVLPRSLDFSHVTKWPGRKLHETILIGMNVNGAKFFSLMRHEYNFGSLMDAIEYIEVLGTIRCL